MNKLAMILLLAISIAFAVKPVPRAVDGGKNDKPAVTIHGQKDEDRSVENNTENVVTKNDKNDKDKDKTPVNKDDKIVDVDSNNVNDQRENDLLKIKQLKSKFLQDLLKKIPGSSDEDEHKKPSRPVAPPKKKNP